MPFSRRVFLAGVAAFAVLRPKPPKPTVKGVYSDTYSNTY